MSNIYNELEEMREELFEDQNEFFERKWRDRLGKGEDRYSEEIQQSINYIMSKSNAKVVKYLNQFFMREGKDYE